MFTPSAESLKAFYESPLGAVACRTLRRHIRNLWPREMAHPETNRDEIILGLGFATPYMTPLLKPYGSKVTSRAIAFMPPAQGVTRWPGEKPNRVAMAEETRLPLSDNSVGRVLMVHSLEHAENPRQLLREVWRVLDPGGSLILITPSRSGLWARTEKTPFGHGRPFSEGQLNELLSEAMLTPVVTKPVLFLPPSERRFLIRTADMCEKMGRVMPFLGGALIAGAEKQLYATAAPKGKKQRVLAKAVE